MENSACILEEAQQVIDKWLKDTSGGQYGSDIEPTIPLASSNGARKRQRSKHVVTGWNGASDISGIGMDYISGMDFVNTDISQCVDTVMSGMYTQPLERDVLRMIERDQQVSANPAITMEARHKQVKSRRKRREHQRTVLLKAQAAEKESRVAAERLVRSEQEAAKMKQKQEEALVRLEMVKIRKQLKEKQEREKLLQELDETLGDVSGGNKPSPPHEGDAVLSTAHHVMDEVLKDRMRAETRRVLVKQLAEAETIEIKDNNKLLRRCFNVWLDVVHDSRLAQEKAHTAWVWRTKCHVFQAWKGLIEQHRRQQELSNLALQLQWEKRCMEMAALHYHHSLVAKVFTSWKRWCSTCKEVKLKELTRRLQQEKMAALLARVSAVRHDDPSLVEGQLHDEKVVKEDELHQQDARKECQPVCQDESGVVSKENKSDHQHHMKSHKPVHPTKAKHSKDSVPSLITSKLVRQELEKLLADNKMVISSKSQEARVTHDECSTSTKTVVKLATTKKSTQPPSTDHSAEHQSSFPKQHPAVHKPVVIARQPPTKPVAMLGMERRAQMMAERRQEREDRKRQREEELLATRKQEQQKKEEEALAEREAFIKKKKEERRLAKQKEKEKQEHLIELQHKVTMATEHYNNWLLKYRGILPWKQFIAKVHEDNDTALQFHIKCVTKRSLLTWVKQFEARNQERYDKADKFYATVVIRRSLLAWKQYVHDMRHVSNHADQFHKWLLVRRHFKCWHGYMRQQEVDMWEKERRAKLHYYRSIKRKMLMLWHDYIPVAKEERLKEQRRDELRKKVSKWLPDYQATSDEI